MAVLILLIIGSALLCWEGLVKIWDSGESSRSDLMVGKL